MASFFALAALAPSVLFAQGTVTHAAPSAYAGQAAVGEVTFAADYLVRSIPVAGGVLVSRGYLVVDVAVFSRLRAVSLTASYFSLRLNGSKAAILAQQPFIVANSFDYRRPDPGEPGATIGASVGNVGVIVGTPGQQPTRGQTGNPGGLETGGPPVPIGQRDPRVPEPNVRNTPPTQRVPETPNPYLIDKAPPPPTPREQVERAALPSGDVVPPVSGALFFAYQDKPESLRAIELLYDGPAGKATLKLR